MRDNFDKEQDKKQVELLLNSIEMYNDTIREARFKNKDIFNLVPLFSARGEIENNLLSVLEKIKEKDNKEEKSKEKKTIKIPKSSNVVEGTHTECNSVEGISAIKVEGITDIAIRLTNEKWNNRHGIKKE